MAAPTLEHQSSFKFQHSSPLDALVRRTSSRRVQGPSKLLFGQVRHDRFPPSHPNTSNGSHLPTFRALQQQQQEKIPPSSPLLHTQFRGSTFSTVTHDHNSFVGTSTIAREMSQEAEDDYDDASVYSTPSTLPSPRGQGSSDLCSDHEQPSGSWNVYTATTDTNGGLAYAETDLSLPTVVISPAVDPDPPSSAFEPTRGGKVPVAVPSTFNFSRPGRPPQLPPDDLKRQGIERNAGRQAAHSPPPLSIPVVPNAVALGIPRNMTAGPVPPSSLNGVVDPPLQRSARPSIILASTTGSSGARPHGYMSESTTEFRQLPGANVSSEIRGPGLQPSHDPILMPGQAAPSAQHLWLPSSNMLNDLPSPGTSAGLAPNGVPQLPRPRVSVRMNPLYQHLPHPQGVVNESGFPQYMAESSSQSSVHPDPSTSFTSYAGPSPMGLSDGSPRNTNFDDSSSLEPGSSPGQPQFSHWSVDGASLLGMGPPPRVVDHDRSLSPSGSAMSGKKRNKLRKSRKDGYESEGHIGDTGKKKKGKVNGKKIVVLRPEPQHDSYSRGSLPLDDHRSEGPTQAAISMMPLSSPRDFSHSAESTVDDHGEWNSPTLNNQDHLSSSLSSLLTGTQDSHYQPTPVSLDDPHNLDTSQNTSSSGTAPIHAHDIAPALQNAAHSHYPLDSISSDDPSHRMSPPTIGPYSVSPADMSLRYQKSRRVAAPLSPGDSSTKRPPGSRHFYDPLPMLATGLSPTSPLPSPRSHQRGPMKGLPPPLSLASSPETQHPQIRIDESSSAGHSWNANSDGALPLSRSPSPAFSESHLPGSSPIPKDAPSRPSTETVTCAPRPTIELPRAPPPRVTSPAASVYSQYSFYQLDGGNASPPGSKTHSYLDSHSSSTRSPVEPRPPLLSPHYIPPAKFPIAGSRSISSSSILSPTHTLSPYTPTEYLQLGIQHHEANRLKDAAICFEKSAKHDGGCGVGMVMWGLTLRHGWGCEKNETLGFEWLQKAAESAVTDLESSRKGLDSNAVQVVNYLLIVERLNRHQLFRMNSSLRSMRLGNAFSKVGVFGKTSRWQW